MNDPRFEPTPVECPNCNGWGVWYDDQSDRWGEAECKHCNGSGLVVEEEPEKEFEYNED